MPPTPSEPQELSLGKKLDITQETLADIKLELQGTNTYLCLRKEIQFLDRNDIALFGIDLEDKLDFLFFLSEVSEVPLKLIDVGNIYLFVNKNDRRILKIELISNGKKI
ncbi:hypothetical protein JTB14_032960 [Gonioctena quinquepunctata]|nr:hypothetical protein JTB14_032960 [Gonioctena quinquepunctata]